MNINNILKVIYFLFFFSVNVLAGEKEDNFINGKSLDCENCKLVGLKLKHMNLRGANLKNADLRTTSFHRSDLFGANFDNANNKILDNYLIITKKIKLNFNTTSDEEDKRYRDRLKTNLYILSRK